MLKTEKLVNVKRSSKNRIQIVREHYLRNDIPCKSLLCKKCLQPEGTPLLNINANHYLVPDGEVMLKYFEVFQLDEITDIIFMQTVVQYFHRVCGKKQKEKFHWLLKNALKRSVLFNNEHHVSCYIARKHNTNIDSWRFENIYSAAMWYFKHINEVIPLIVLTEDEELIMRYENETTGVFVMTLHSYISGFWPNLQEAMDLLDSIRSSLSSSIGFSICEEFRDYFPDTVLQSGMKTGCFFSGYLRVNKHQPSQEAFVQLSDSKKPFMGSEVLISGTGYRNRAIHGDLVVVEIFPKDKWQSRTSSISPRNNEVDAVDKESEPMMSGCIVGLLQQNSRSFVVSIGENEKATSKYFLTIPWDSRIPKIRIASRQAATLKDKRFVVQIDNWKTSSFYPNGHFVKTLGMIGETEAEIATILAEHDIAVSEFSQQVMQEMPDSQTWCLESEEVERRRDIRSSHLVFSIDPHGCEDVDDTLSVKPLTNGECELGVHIADVTYFVKQNSFTDLEARSKSTTVYLADRRYDMLPSVLSADLCSLISGVDRYAVSVIWRFDNDFNVLDVWYGRTVICSKYKLSYESAQRIADDDLHLHEVGSEVTELKDANIHVLQQQYAELRQSIRLLMKISRNLKAQRSCQGAVDLESSEIQFSLDGDSKQIKHLIPKKPLEVHETIAECMIYANHWVAKKICVTFKNCALLRHHPPPNQEYFDSLKECGKIKGFEVETSCNEALAESLDRCLDVDPNFNKIMRMLATQAMMVASYFSTGSLDKEKHFHYGLALDSYTHFTSPIRRYADVIVHRLLLASVGDPSADRDSLLGNHDLQNLCDHINKKHRAADQAQRSSVQFFLSQYFKGNSNDSACLVDALVYRLKTNGLLVFIPKYGIKGVVCLKDNSGQVAFPNHQLNVNYFPGSLTKCTDKLIVQCTEGSWEIVLFSYLKVRISVTSCKAHMEKLNFELVSFAVDVSFDDRSAVKVAREEVVRNVRSAQEKRKLDGSDSHGSDSRVHLRSMYSQTHPSVSLYEMFREFKQSSLLLKRKV